MLKLLMRFHSCKKLDNWPGFANQMIAWTWSGVITYPTHRALNEGIVLGSPPT
jgi:hypothetical protein